MYKPIDKTKQTYIYNFFSNTGIVKVFPFARSLRVLATQIRLVRQGKSEHFSNGWVLPRAPNQRSNLGLSQTAARPFGRTSADKASRSCVADVQAYAIFEKPRA